MSTDPSLAPPPSTVAAAVVAPADPPWPPALAGCAMAVLQAQASLGHHPMAVKDAHTGRYLHVNAAMAELFGRAPEAVVGCTDGQLLSAHRAAALRAADQTALAQHPQPSVTAHRFEWGGRRRHFEAVRVRVEAPPGSDAPAAGWIVSFWSDRAEQDAARDALAALRRQIDQDQRQYERLRREAAGLFPGYEALEGPLRREHDLSTRERREFALMLIEIDPPVADDPPRSAEIAARQADALDRLILANTRAMDTVCRIAPGQVAVLLSGVGVATAYGRADSLRQQSLRYAVATGAGTPPESGAARAAVQADAPAGTGFGISVGVAGFPHSATDRGELVERAVQALHQARRRGGDRVVLAPIPFPRRGR